MESDQFTDWHIDISDPPAKSIIFPGQIEVPDHLVDFCSKLASAIREAHKGSVNRFMVDVEGVRFRIQYMKETRYAARLVKSFVPGFNDLSIRVGYRDMFLNDDLRRTGGLVIICGLPGAGKTSTAVAMVKERLSKYGGFCLTVEDPPEYNLEGRHGVNGYCEQLDASAIGYEDVIVTMLRCFPSHSQSILLFGEIRDSVSAAELLRIALDGHIVITTLHASDIIMAIQRLISMAGKDGEQEARSLLAGSLRLIVHQRMDNHVVQMTGLQSNDMVSSTIQNGNLITLRDEIMRQQNRLGMNRLARAGGGRS